MGTRGLTMVVKDDKPVIAQYGQWDHYPSGQGLTALAFLKDEDDALGKLVDVLPRVRFAEDHEIAGKTLDDFPQMSRDHGAEILNVVVKAFDNDEVGTLLLRDDSDFAKDSLFCEWAYVIDLDKRTFEVYKGFQTEPNLGRFAALAPEPSHYKENSYFPVTLVAEWSLDNLPSEDEFMQLESQEDDEDC